VNKIELVSYGYKIICGHGLIVASPKTFTANRNNSLILKEIQRDQNNMREVLMKLGAWSSVTVDSAI